jgi:hypothetical protein
MQAMIFRFNRLSKRLYNASGNGGIIILPHPNTTQKFEKLRYPSPEEEWVIEDPIVGFRAAAPCLAANDSYIRKK